LPRGLTRLIVVDMVPTFIAAEELVPDAAWEQIAPVLPAAARTGRPRANDRRTVAAVLHVLGTGCRWCDLPSELGSYVTAWRRYRDWTQSGVWRRVWRELCVTWTAAERHDWEQRFEENPRARASGAIAGQEMWIDAQASEVAIDQAVSAYEWDLGDSLDVLSNGGVGADWGL